MILRQRVRSAHIPIFNARRRCVSTSALERRVQAYVSTSSDPYVNLSIEHYFLQKSAAESALLFLYINRPSIIIGRNQNPWLEVNLALLNQAHRGHPETEPPGLGAVDLVRRRSGGGTVFHDEGNVNWTIICPSVDFTRDKHAEMIVRALRSCGVERARVNERHDIVLDQGERGGESDPDDTHMTPFTNAGNDEPRPLKVSGSAYKLTRGRALHHGTCLLSSPNLNVIPDYLHSPAKPYIKARGVESVSSPVSNILIGNEEFTNAVQSAFAKQYDVKDQLGPEHVGEDLLEIEATRNGCEELKSFEWKYLSTPQFTISNASDPQARVGLELTVRYGVLTGGSITHGDGRIDIGNELSGVKLHEIDSWESTLGSNLRHLDAGNSEYLLGWLQKMLPHTRKE